MSEEYPRDDDDGSEVRRHTVVWWWIAVFMMGLGGAATIMGGWIVAVPGLIVLILTSISLSKEWAYSSAGAVGIWLFLVLSGFALSWAIILAACSSFRF